MAGIFICYRRDDSKHAAGRLHRELSLKLPGIQIFIDVDDLPVGLDYIETLSEKVGSCDALIAVIGPAWLDAKDSSNRRRLMQSNDRVRIEISAALQRNVPVVPLLLDGTLMPPASQLPVDLRMLPRRQAIEMAHVTFASDAHRLASELRKVAPALRRSSHLLKFFARLVEKRPHSALERIPPTFQSEAAVFHSEVGAKRFYEDRILSAPGASLTATQLYEDYCVWCESRGLEPLALPTFGRDFGDIGVQKAKIAGRVRYIDVALKGPPRGYSRQLA